MPVLAGLVASATWPAAQSATQPAAQTAAAAPVRPSAGVQPLVTDPETRWSFGPFAFESEPTPAGAHVLVTGRDPTGRRALVVLDAASGRVLARTLFASSTPLGLSASGERVAVRTAPGRVELYRLRGARLLAERSFAPGPALSVPSLAGEELLLREGDELACYDLGRHEPRWRARVPGAFHGTPVARGEAVFAGWYDESGGAHLAWLERASGRMLGDVGLGRHRDGRASEERDALTVVAHSASVFVELARGIPSTSGLELAWSRVPFDGARLGAPTLHDLLAEPTETADGWVAPERTRSGAARWVLVRRDAARNDGRERAIELAAPEHHAWLSAYTQPASRAGDVLYLGPCAAEGRSLQVLWRRTSNPSFRPVPVDGGLLVVEGDRLHLLGSEASTPDAERERARERVLAEERTLGEQLARIAAQAVRSGDGELAARLVDEAEALGANARVLAPVRAEAERLGTAALSDARLVQRRSALVAEERAARERLPRALAEAARAAATPELRRALLGELFACAPEHPAGLTELRRLLPAGAPLVPAQARAWLAFLELAAVRPIELLGTGQLSGTSSGMPSPEEQRLAEGRKSWRADVLGYQSERLLVVTAAAAPDAVARTLQGGELVCDVLEQVFGGARGAAGRLELLLYPTREEYLHHSGSDLGGLETVLGFTAGHFDLGAELSRLFLPPEDEDGARLLGVSAHELTHHWLATRSLFGPLVATNSTTGFWIVEGVATWAEELRLDPARRHWSTDSARAASLDTLANAGARDLLPWTTVLAASFDEYCKLETRTTCSLSLDWQLGAHAPRSPMQLFYAQGGALAHWLYESDDGARRALFLQAVEGYYRGTPLDLAAALGTAPEELGARVVAWARERTRTPASRDQ